MAFMGPFGVPTGIMTRGMQTNVTGLSGGGVPGTVGQGSYVSSPMGRVMGGSNPFYNLSMLGGMRGFNPMQGMDMLGGSQDKEKKKLLDEFLRGQTL
jgi:hypothetical protein